MALPVRIISGETSAARYLGWLLDECGSDERAALRRIEQEIEHERRVRDRALALLDGLPSHAHDARRRQYRKIAAAAGRLSRLDAMLTLLQERM